MANPKNAVKPFWSPKAAKCCKMLQGKGENAPYRCVPANFVVCIKWKENLEYYINISAGMLYQDTVE